MITVSLVTYGWNLFAMFVIGNLFMLALQLWITNNFFRRK